MSEIDAPIWITCECQMRYRPEYPPDVIRNKFHHDKFVNGISVRRRPDDEVVREEPGMRVLVVRPKASSAQRKQATNVARTIRREFQIQFGIYEATDENNVEWQKHVLLACKNDRAIGFLLLQKRYASQEWSVFAVWVAQQFRRQGIATMLVNEASRIAGVPVIDLHYQGPLSDSGGALVQSISPEAMVLP